MDDTWRADGVSALLALVASRVLDLEESDAVGAEHSRDCDYAWMLSVRESRGRFDGLLQRIWDSPAEAVADALNFREEVLACGFEEVFRCEVMAARVEDMSSHTMLGWRGRVDLGLRRTGSGA